MSSGEKAGRLAADIIVKHKYSIWRRNLRRARHLIDYSTRRKVRKNNERILILREKTFLAFLGYVEKYHRCRKWRDDIVRISIQMWYSGKTFNEVRGEVKIRSYNRAVQNFGRWMQLPDFIIDQMNAMTIKRSGLIHSYLKFKEIDASEFVRKYHFRII